MNRYVFLACLLAMGYYGQVIGALSRDSQQALVQAQKTIHEAVVASRNLLHTHGEDQEKIQQINKEIESVLNNAQQSKTRAQVLKHASRAKFLIEDIKKNYAKRAKMVSDVHKKTQAAQAVIRRHNKKFVSRDKSRILTPEALVKTISLTSEE